MRFYTIIFLVVIMLSACSSPEKLLQKGNYDALIDKSVKNLIKNPNSEEDANNLDKAYNLANSRDLDRVKYLKMEGNPDSWDEILSLYANLNNRQANVKKVLPLHIGGRTVQYDYVNYDAEIVEAKKNAAEYYYTHGKKLMDNNTKDSYRQAYYELNKAKTYSGGSYSDLDQLINQAHYLGVSRVLVGVVNRTPLNLPPEFMDGLVAVNASDLNSEWVEFYTRKPDKDIAFDYYIDIILQSIQVSPEQATEKDYIEKKTVENGFDYALDAKGNVMKDSAGNDIKIKKYKDIQCTVIEQTQIKDCTITGETDFSTANPETLFKKQPISAGTHFEHVWARAVGDLAALSPEKKRLVDIGALPFPTDAQMISDCTEALKKSINDAIHANRGLIK